MRGMGEKRKVENEMRGDLYHAFTSFLRFLKRYFYRRDISAYLGKYLV